MLTNLRRRFLLSAPDPVLPSYIQPIHPAKILFRNIIFISVTVGVSMFYGLMCAIFPVSFFPYMALPLALLAALVVWALPEAKSFPERAIERFLFLFLLAMFLWPNYLAIAIPGLPWITINRLVSFPLAVIFVISISTSPALRAQIKSVISENKLVTYCVIAFGVCQTYTLPIAGLGNGIDQYIDSQTQWISTLFISMWVFTRPDRAQRFMKLFLISAVFLVFIALAEWRLGYPIWRDHIPSFLRPADENVQRILRGQVRSGVGVYRVQATFSTSLNLAEFLAFSYSVVFYWLLRPISKVARLLLLGYIPLSFFVITLTDSRTGPVGTAVTVLIGGALYFYRRWRTEKIGLLPPFMLVLYPFGVACFVGLSLVWNRLKVMTWGGGQHQASTDTRADQWANFWPALAKWPFGYGVGAGAQQAGTINGTGVFTLDSYYIAQFLNFGLIGGLAYFGMFGIGALTAFRAGVRTSGDSEDALLASGLMLVVFLVSKLVLIQDDSHGAIFMALGLICAQRWVISQRSGSANEV